MFIEPYILFPLICGLVYSLASIVLRRAAEKGVDALATTVLFSWLIALLCLPLFVYSQTAISQQLLFEAALAGILFFAGQLFTFKAISKGDVSLITPIMGCKVVLVALFSVLFLDEQVPAACWLAASLAIFASYLSSRQGPGAGAGAGIAAIIAAFYALLSAALFALTDIVIQKCSPHWGANAFIPMLFFVNALLSLVILPKTIGPARQLSASAWRWLLAGAVLMTIQALGIGITIGQYGHATVANIMYSSRAVWSVLIVWSLGHLFGNIERSRHGHAIMALRLGGAALILIAIWLVV